MNRVESYAGEMWLLQRYGNPGADVVIGPCGFEEAYATAYDLTQSQRWLLASGYTLTRFTPQRVASTRHTADGRLYVSWDGGQTWEPVAPREARR